MSGGGAWGRGTGTEPADGPDGAGARAPARGSGVGGRGSGAGGRGWARRGGGPRAELGEPSWAGAVTCEPWKERCATPGKLAALCTHSRTLLGGPWVCPRTTRWGAGHPPQRLGGSTTASRLPAARPGSSSGLGSRSPFAGGGEPAQGLWRRLLRPGTGLRGRCIWLWGAGALPAGLAAAGAAAALGVLIPQKMVMPRGLSGHVPGLAKTAHPKLLQISDSSLPRLASLGINIPDLC